MGDLELHQGGDVAPMSVETIRAQVNLIQHVMREVMIEGQHFGVVPGTEKPSLMKAGAEKLNMTFHLRARYPQVQRTDMPNGHREIQTQCQLVSPAGEVIGEGWGSCSTMESRYRYRNVSDYEILEDPIPSDAKERKQEYRKQGLGMKKVNGVWVWVKYKDAQRQENPDIADTYNTVLKMSNKRALVAATLNATAASDIFTQDMEEVDPGVEPEKAAPRNVTPPQPAGRVLKPDATRQGLLDRLAVLGPFLTDDEKATVRADTPPMATEALARYVEAWEARLHQKGAL